MGNTSFALVRSSASDAHLALAGAGCRGMGASGGSFGRKRRNACFRRSEDANRTRRKRPRRRELWRGNNRVRAAFNVCIYEGAAQAIQRGIMSTKKLEKCRRSGRDRLQMLYGHLYEFDPREDRMKCCYCGDVRECVDHVPALHVVDMLGSKKVRELDVDFFLYPSCHKCNSTLHASFLLTYEERLSFLYDHYLKKADKETFWPIDEIEELGGSLRDMIVARQKQLRRELLDRIRGIEINLCNLGKRR